MFPTSICHSDSVLGFLVFNLRLLQFSALSSIKVLSIVVYFLPVDIFTKVCKILLCLNIFSLLN